MKKAIELLIVIGSFSIAKAQNTGINTNTLNTNMDPALSPIKPMFADTTKALYPNPTNTTSIPDQKQTPYLQNIGNDTKGIRKDSLRK